MAAGAFLAEASPSIVPPEIWRPIASNRDINALPQARMFEIGDARCVAVAGPRWSGVAVDCDFRRLR
jgi:hypothetical protein